MITFEGMKKMDSEKELVWFAGFLDGRGLFYWNFDPDKKKRTKFRIMIFSTDWKETKLISKMLNKIGVSHSIHSLKREKGRKEEIYIELTNRVEIVKLLLTIRDYLKVRREKANEMLRAILDYYTLKENKTHSRTQKEILRLFSKAKL